MEEVIKVVDFNEILDDWERSKKIILEFALPEKLTYLPKEKVGFHVSSTTLLKMVLFN